MSSSRVFEIVIDFFFVIYVNGSYLCHCSGKHEESNKDDLI